jgi:hypothetical protein
MTTTSLRPASSYRTQVSGVLLAAFALSAAHTVYGTIAGVAPDEFNARNPVSWAFYALGSGMALAARTDRTAVWRALAVYLPVLLAVGLFWYPSVFTAKLQTPIGWIENDGYMALLGLALYLTVQRLRGASLAR